MHQPTIRVIEVLNYVIKETGYARLADLSRELGIPKSTLLPILQTLCEYGYISQNSLGEYGAGVLLFSLSTYFSGRFPIMDYVRNKLNDLVDDLGETCYFGVLEDGYVRYLDKVDSPKPLRMLISTGRRLPAYATGIGKALLSDMTKAELVMIYPDGLKSITENTITDFDILAGQMSDAAKRGYACEIEESTEHIRCFAVPIRKHGRIAAAISVAIPVFRYDESGKNEIIEKLKYTASQISSVLEQTDANLI